MINLSPIFLTDFYKTGHADQYPPGTELIFSNFTPRKSRLRNVNHSIFFGLHYFIKEYLQNYFKYRFFIDKIYMPGHTYSDSYHNFLVKTLGNQSVKDNRPFDRITNLSKLGYLPIAIYALPELSIVPCNVPALVMFNTHPAFFWVPNFLETILSCVLWGACTSATIACEFRNLLDSFAEKTSTMPEFVDYQAHDFSFRGMFGLEAAMLSGAAHLQYFKGTDSIPALFFNEFYYDKPFGITSVPATEHSVMSAYGKEYEENLIQKLITEIYPAGIISIVCDTWDLWHVVGNILPKLKNTILQRNGRVVIRPDSGDPVKILCGNPDGKNPWEKSGLIESLFIIFGGEVNSKGYTQLPPQIGAIYGDSITYENCKDILSKLLSEGYASTNVVFGLGSYTYQYNTRDTLGWAFKSTYCEIGGVGKAIIKDPVTDDGTKKSHSGLLKVVKNAKGKYEVRQNQTWEQFYAPDNELKIAFENGCYFD